MIFNKKKIEAIHCRLEELEREIAVLKDQERNQEKINVELVRQGVVRESTVIGSPFFTIVDNRIQLRAFYMRFNKLLSKLGYEFKDVPAEYNKLVRVNKSSKGKAGGAHA